ncbi:NADH-quinone oxidoreductase subunit L [Rhodothalassium salexigens]|uniref:NADH-quinone oxidoreductase subunit L n=1 Tax=Rhodothalassium salexigens TaxID=1086 RepID=UPI0019115F31|nr:NADH-quinone oxidoreductase subunit L [Rhodothalassium salexigens]MBK5911666.1 NADH-quinone oxidoreductase subunit L [Rhodothalassium salexigens]
MIELIVFLPLAGFLAAGLAGQSLGDRGSMLLTSSFVTVSALLSVALFFEVSGNPDAFHTVTLGSWIASGDLAIDWALRVDTLTAVMLVVVNGVSALVHWYSVGYMAHDPSKPRFFAYLSLFTFAMLMLVTADNLVQMFFGWEGVGLASYLLIGFWYQKPSANAASIKAFVVNRIGDFGYSLGIFATFLLFGSVQFDTIFANVDAVKGTTLDFVGYDVPALTLVALLLFVGAMGKSAQLILHTWLPDAMEGPTPVSALIHAATMVTAGVFLIARMSPLFEAAPDALAVVTVIGAATAFFAATVGLVQNDIKRVIAYSTCSQLGYMFFALGVGAYGAGIFHLFTHAFFKALMFLSAGSVIHALSDEQDMRRMGGLRPHLQTTWALMLVGTLALTGVGIPGLIGFSGFYSKDIVIEAAYAGEVGGSLFAFVMGIAAVFMTSFYSWRLMFMTFENKPRASKDVMGHIHESPMVMLVPLFVLAGGAVFAGLAFQDWFVGDGRLAFWAGSIVQGEHDVIEQAHHVSKWVKWLPTAMMALGLGAAWLFYIRSPQLPGQVAASAKGLYQFLLNKWYFDELYRALIVRPVFALGRLLWIAGDQKTIDGLGPDGVSRTLVAGGKRMRRVQSGYVYHYAFAMLVGVVILVSYIAFYSGGF